MLWHAPPLPKEAPDLIDEAQAALQQALSTCTVRSAQQQASICLILPSNMTRQCVDSMAPERESFRAGCKGMAALLSLLPCSAAQGLLGPRSPVVFKAFFLLAALHLQEWEFGHNLGRDTDPAHLLRSANMATSALRFCSVRPAESPTVLH